MIGALLDHLWQSTLILGVAGVLTLALRSNGARSRYGLWFAASMKFLIPVAALTSLASRFASSSTTSMRFLLPLHGLAERLSVPFAARAPLASGAALHVTTQPAPHWAAVALVIWALGCGAVLLSWGVRWRRIRRVVAAARPLPLTAPIPIVECQAAIEPSLVGIWHPVVMFPQGLAQRLSAAELRGILAHELAHYRRRDNLTSAAHMLVQALFWFYPPVWWLGARLLAERERACDESVLAAGLDARTYAEGILKVCRFFARPGIACAAGVSGADLKRRVEAIMSAGFAVPVSRAKKVVISSAFVGALGASLLLAMPVAHVAQAQTSKGANPTPAQRAALRAEQMQPQKQVPFNPADFDKYAGYYEFTPTAFFHVYRHGDHYFAQLTGQPPVEWFAESPTKFFATVVAAQISFVANARGKVIELILHQNGLLRPAIRVPDSTALRAAAELRMRIRHNVPSPGTAAALRRQIESIERTGHELYGEMAPGLAGAAREQATRARALFKSMGPFESLRFYKVLPNGVDDYMASFAHGKLEIMIAPLASDGKITGLFYHPIP